MLKAQKDRINLSFFVFVLFPVLLSPAYAPGAVTPIRDAAERLAVIERLRVLRDGIHSMTSSVHQTKHISVLKEDITTTGRITMRKPDLLRWETLSPERSSLVVRGKTMTVYFPDLSEAEQYDLSRNTTARTAMSFFSSLLWGTEREMEKRFDITMSRSDGELVLEMVPLSKIAARYVSSVTVYYSELTGVPVGFDVLTPKGDRTSTRFADVVINPELEPDTFTIRLPRGVFIRADDESRHDE